MNVAARQRDHRAGAHRRRRARGLPGRRAQGRGAHPPRVRRAAPQPVRRHHRHLGRRDQRRRAGLPRRPLRPRGGRRREHLAPLQRRPGLPRRRLRRGPHRRALADDAVARLGHRALAPRAAALAARQQPAWPSCCSGWCTSIGCPHCCARAICSALAVTGSSLQQRRARHLLPDRQAVRALAALAARGRAEPRSGCRT